MIYIARAYYEDEEFNKNSLRWSQLMRKVAGVHEETLVIDVTTPQEVGSIQYTIPDQGVQQATAVLFCQEWFKDDVCIKQFNHCKAYNIPAFFALDKLEQYITDINTGEVQ